MTTEIEIPRTGDGERTGEEAGATGRTEPEADSFGEDGIFHLLQNRRRRLVFRYLDQSEGTVEMRDIAEQVAAWEHDTTLQALSSDQRQRVYIALYQAHLPKLDAAGVIEYNQDRGHVTPTDRLGDLTSYINLLNGADDDGDEAVERARLAVDWGQYYLGASGAGVLLLALSALGVSVFAGLSDLALAAVVVAMFSLLSVGHLSDRYQLANDS